MPPPSPQETAVGAGDDGGIAFPQTHRGGESALSGAAESGGSNHRFPAGGGGFAPRPQRQALSSSSGYKYSTGGEGTASPSISAFEGVYIYRGCCCPQQERESARKGETTSNTLGASSTYIWDGRDMRRNWPQEL